MQPIKIAFDTSAQWTTRNRNLIEFYSWNSMYAWILQGHIDKNTWNLEKTHSVSVLARKSLKWKKYVNKRDSVEKKEANAYGLRWFNMLVNIAQFLKFIITSIAWRALWKCWERLFIVLLRAFVPNQIQHFNKFSTTWMGLLFEESSSCSSAYSLNSIKLMGSTFLFNTKFSTNLQT